MKTYTKIINGNQYSKDYIDSNEKGTIKAKMSILSKAIKESTAPGEMIQEYLKHNGISVERI